MRFGVFHQASAAEGQSHADRYAEMLDLIALADELIRVCRPDGTIGMINWTPEGFIGQAMLVALDYGMDHPSIITEHRGSLARRGQSGHCKGITDDVTTSPFACSHCGLTLLVRDHYSRRLAAFQGVNIDAEEPGSAPQPKELFL